MDVVGRLKVPITNEQLRITNDVPKLQRALNLLHLGEIALGRDEQPWQAISLLQRAQALASHTDPVRGLAAYETGIALFMAGAYGRATSQFMRLTAAHTGLSGFDGRNALLWLRHAGACANYHAQHAALGIPEPSHLDPLCGVSGLAICAQALQVRASRGALLAAVRHTGEGSNMQDIADGAKRMGLTSHAVTADDIGLQALPLPAVAHVERDHFITVTHADRTGVTYVCSDCGPWPGGAVRLTWKQWHMLSPDVYLVVTRPGSPEDAAFAPLAAADTRPGTRLASLTVSRATARRLGRAASMAHHVMLWQQGGGGIVCGSKRVTLACPCPIPCPKDRVASAGGGAGGGAGAGLMAPVYSIAGGGSGGGGGAPDRFTAAGASGPSAGDPVNLATGDEEYTPAADLNVFNPHGPSVSWSREYRSLRGPSAGYQSDDFGIGWSTNYNYYIRDPEPPSNNPYPDATPGATIAVIVGGAEGPAGGMSWDILQGSTVVASSGSPGGWAVASQTSSDVQVTVDSGAAVYSNYKVRYLVGTSPYSGLFNVISATTILQGGTLSTPGTGTDMPAAGTWDIINGQGVVGTSADPAGWTVSFTSHFGMTNFTLTAPNLATIGGGYEVRYNYNGSGNSATFTVTGNRYTCSAGPKFLGFPNGAEIQFTAPSVPTYSNPVVQCTWSTGGIPMLVEWDYDSTLSGHFTFTMKDRSKLITTTLACAIGKMDKYFLLGSVADRFGNAIGFNYGDIGSTTFPLLQTITDLSNGSALLTITRTGGTGNISKVVDAYGRKVTYHVGGYTAQKSPPWNPPLVYQELDQVSEIVPVSNQSPPERYGYGYTNINNGEGNEQVPFMTGISVPSPTGVGMTSCALNYASGGLLTSIVDANGNSRNYTFGAGTATVVVKDRNANTVYTYSVGYDLNMSITSMTDGNNHVVGGELYSDPNDPYAPSRTVDGNGNFTYHTWDTKGNMLTETSPRGTQTTNTYDYNVFALGRLLTVQQGSKAPTTITYNEPSGTISTVKTPPPGTTNSGNTVTTSALYDSVGNVTSVTSPGNNATTTITTTFNYTTDGTYTQGEELGLPILITNNIGKQTHVRYDARGNTTSVTDAIGNTVTSTFNLADQELTSVYPATGENGTGQSSAYLNFLYVGGPLVQAIAYDESNTAIRQATVTYGKEGEPLSRSGSLEPATLTLDALYRPVSLSDGNNHATTWQYNLQGYVSQIQYPLGDKVQFTSYDGAGNVLSRTDGNNVVTNYSHNTDSESRLTAISYPATPGLNVGFTYDSYGRVTEMTDGTGYQTYSYDDLDNATTIGTRYTGLPTEDVSYSFYNDGSRSGMTASGVSFSYTYDAVGRMTGMTNPSGEATSWTYLDNNWLKTQTLNNGLVTTNTFDALGRVTRVLNAVSGSTISDFNSMNYDGIGSRTSLTASVPGHTAYGGSTTWGYDVKSELTSEVSGRAGSFNNSFGYDGAGNLTSFKGAANTFNSNNQNSAFTWDGNGNPTTYKGATLAFDAENRLTSIPCTGGTFTAAYRGDNLRAWKNTPNGRMYFLYDGIQPVMELDSSGNVTAINTYGDSGLVSRYTNASVRTYYAFDNQGSVAERLDNSGAVTSHSVYDAYGAFSSTASPTDPFGYEAQAGYFTDNETGLIALAFRYYDPSTGRFLNRDPIGMHGGINVYGYVGNGPGGGVDVWGLAWARMNIGTGETTFGPQPSDPPDGDFPTYGGFVGGLACDGGSELTCEGINMAFKSWFEGVGDLVGGLTDGAGAACDIREGTEKSIKACTPMFNGHNLAGGEANRDRLDCMLKSGKDLIGAPSSPPTADPGAGRPNLPGGGHTVPGMGYGGYYPGPSTGN